LRYDLARHCLRRRPAIETANKKEEKQGAVVGCQYAQQAARCDQRVVEMEINSN